MGLILILEKGLTIHISLSLTDLIYRLNYISSIQSPYDNHSNSIRIILMKALQII